MKVGVVLLAAEVDGQGKTPGWDEVRSFALAAEARGLDSVWMFDHFLNTLPSGEIEGMHEAWTVLSAIAAVTRRVEVGTLVLCTSFRSPAMVAKMAATADAVSQGRLILGLGAGWHDPEYRAFGYPTDHRVSRFEEALRIIVPLLSGETVTFAGRFGAVDGAVLTSPPTRHIPVLIAADGPRMLRLTARFADAWNTAWYGAPDDRLRKMLKAFDDALVAEDRDPVSIARTVGVRVTDPEIVPPDADPSISVGTSVDDLARAIEDYAALGIDHLVVGLEPKSEASLDQLTKALELASSRL